MNSSYKELLTEDFLKREYIDLMKSVQQIANENAMWCRTITKFMGDQQ
jgi:hypothetical protein